MATDTTTLALEAMVTATQALATQREAEREADRARQLAKELADETKELKALVRDLLDAWALPFSSEQYDELKRRCDEFLRAEDGPE